ncbi:hypothetical protein [Methylobacterium sp. WL8]|uniref:hypothetical protein n=1 Tax=Methylobacterium sp. WL8 TaxID=2603899 RepID=UPI0011C929B4|nr:hypothetical protein [Methylobacterium sp. WL8]TXN78996.1 hypothetical protein FV234_21915 [Methylobacterium sp. WL8]
MHSQTSAWLSAQYEKANKYQTANGISFELTFEDYISLWSIHRLRKLEELVLNNEIKNFQKNKLYAWVLSWRKKSDKAAGVLNRDTAQILLRWESEKLFYIQKGETQSPDARRKISLARRGKPLSAKHKRAIGDARLGVKQTEAHKRKRIEAMKATKARNKLEKLGTLRA